MYHAKGPKLLSFAYTQVGDNASALSMTSLHYVARRRRCQGVRRRRVGYVIVQDNAL